MKQKIFISLIVTSLGIGFLVTNVFLFPGVVEADSLVWVVTEDFSDNHDIANSIIEDGGSIYIAGADKTGGLSGGTANRWRIEKRSKSDGSVEWSTAGPYTGVDNTAHSIDVRGSYVYIAGSHQVFAPPPSLDVRWCVEKRRKSDGAIGPPGTWRENFNYSSNGFSVPYGIDTPSSGNFIYIVGTDNDPGTLDKQWRVASWWKNNGNLGPSETVNYPLGGDVAHSITSDILYVYVVGYDNSQGNARWRIEKRRNTDLFLVWDESSNPSGNHDVAYSITSDNNYLYIAGYDRVLGNARWRIEKWDKNGVPQWEQWNDLSPGDDIAYSITSDDTYIYIAGIDRDPGNAQWRIEKRRKSDGVLVGIETNDPSDFDDFARSIAVDDTYLYIAGYDRDSESGSYQWRIEKRTKTGFPSLCTEHNVWGWAWSENIGWISFSCRDTMAEGEGADYGVDIDEDTGNFSGYAWSENIGWISFNRSETEAPSSDDVCPDGSCIAKLDLDSDTYEVSGWARALAPVGDPNAGGWDGWIKLSGAWENGVSLDTDPDPKEFEGWAWGGGYSAGNIGAGVIGWISFNCEDREAATGKTCLNASDPAFNPAVNLADYKVMTNLVIIPPNNPPTASNLQIASQNYTCDPGLIVKFQWDYQDDEDDSQEFYQLELFDKKGYNPSDIIFTTGKKPLPPFSPNEQDVASPDIDFNTRYWWQVTVWDSEGNSSDPADARSSVPTIDFPPAPEFKCREEENGGLKDCNTINPDENELIDFVDRTTKCDPCSYQWDFGDGDPSSERNPQYSYSTANTYTVILTVSDSDGTCSKSHTITVGTPPLPPPSWIEVPPF